MADAVSPPDVHLSVFRDDGESRLAADPVHFLRGDAAASAGSEAGRPDVELRLLRGDLRGVVQPQVGEGLLQQLAKYAILET